MGSAVIQVIRDHGRTWVIALLVVMTGVCRCSVPATHSSKALYGPMLAPAAVDHRMPTIDAGEPLARSSAVYVHVSGDYVASED